MAAGLLGTLGVKFYGDTAQLTSATSKAAMHVQMEMDNMKRSAQMAGRVLGTTLVSGAALFSVQMKRITDDADNLSKTSQKIGTTTEALSALRYAADISGASFEELTKGIGRLSRTASDANMGLSTAKRSFDNLSISVLDSNKQLKSTEELLLEVADKFSKMSDGTQKAALAQEIFGRGGLALIPLLNEGRAGIKELTDEAERLGIVISSKTGRMAEQFNDDVLRLKSSLNGIFIGIASDLIPVMSQLAKEFLNTTDKANKFNSVGVQIGSTLISIVNGAQFAGEAFKTFGEQLGSIAGVSYLFVTGKFKEAVDAMKNRAKEVEVSWQDMFTAIQDRSSEFKNNIGDDMKSTSELVTEFVRKQGERTKKTFTEMEESVKKNNDLMKDLGRTFSTAFEDAIMGGEKLRNILNSLLDDIARIALRMMIVQPLVDSMFGASGIFNFGGTTAATTTTASAKGNAFSGGNVIPFASGGIINSAISFPMAGGRRGLAGEAGAEAIMPLVRTKSGDLGIRADGGSRTEVNIYAPAGSNVSEERQDFGGMERINIFIDEAVAKNIKSTSKTYRALKETFNIGQRLTNR